MWTWLVRQWHWPAAALFAAVFLLAILPLFAAKAGLALALVFVQLPVYMIHQAEEHLGDRFRLYANRVIGGGREALTPAATFWINSIGVWGIDLLALYLAGTIEPAAGLMAGYLPVLNGITHIGQAVRLREYNPGLVTGIVLFLPVGGLLLWQVGASAGLLWNALGLAAAIVVHALIIAYVAHRLAHLPKSA